VVGTTRLHASFSRISHLDELDSVLAVFGVENHEAFGRHVRAVFGRPRCAHLDLVGRIRHHFADQRIHLDGDVPAEHLQHLVVMVNGLDAASGCRVEKREFERALHLQRALAFDLTHIGRQVSQILYE